MSFFGRVEWGEKNACFFGGGIFYACMDNIQYGLYIYNLDNLWVDQQSLSQFNQNQYGKAVVAT